ITIIRSTGSFDSSICNMRYDSLEILDNRLHDRGLESVLIKPGSAINMELIPNPVPITPGDLVSRVSVKVIDSMLDGSICIMAKDTAKNVSEFCLTYCTIPDKLKPRIEVLRDNGNHLWNVKVHDDTAWDRKIDSIYITSPSNISPVVIPPTRGQEVIYLTIPTSDVTAPSGFCISATDLYGNQSDTLCYFVDAGLDTLKPNIKYDPDPKTDPTMITVSINDIHFNANSTRFKWDTGIDSVWFTDNFEDKMIVPPTIFGHCADSIQSFVLKVRDSLDIDSSACVTVNALDCHGNFAQWNWCYPYPRDLNPPVLLAKYLDKQQIKVYVTDSATYDRGNQIISTDNPVNLTTHSATVNKVPVDSFVLIRPLINESSYATVNTIDYWGSLLPTRIATHSAEIGIHVWIQDLAMKRGLIVRQAQQIELPVYFVKNDTIELAEKSITDFAFTYTPTGDVNSLTLLGVKTLGTASAGWAVTATPVGNSVLVQGHMPSSGGSVLTRQNNSDTLLILQFQTQPDAATRDVTLDITPVNNETVIYNNGRDTIYTALSSTAIMPPPWGTITGAHIVIAGSCAPGLSQGSGTTTAILDIPTPNPAARSAALHYSIPADAFVTIGVYDMLGREVKTVVRQDQKQGTYDIVLDVTELNSGQYVIRLEAGKEIQMRTIVVSK
ncbi:MAG TPA: T9SS type A sorting domain-containing protein, partial [Candidatus Kapabacteria bacterium]|nr:T9SS type A sorting domain-containing protein [Candidatus Kapabacteria bacterium]